jgi:AbrB family transcriptional regulator, transcriptional pleiotropic regulator of transition state genes
MATSLTRAIDDLGRIVIPKEIRKTFGINYKDPIEIFVEDRQIVLKKYVPNSACAITGIVSHQNKKFGGKGLILSPEGIKIILEQLEVENKN